MERSGLRPCDVDILVTACSIYCPTPSMASMVVNHFKMRPDIKSFHLAGMGACGTANHNCAALIMELVCSYCLVVRCDLSGS